MKVCVYCASSRQVDAAYHQQAELLGQLLGQRAFSIVYGGGAVGSMGALADGSLSVGGEVIGVIPRFMLDLEWGHPGIADLRVVEDMHTRKKLMMELADAIVALPGGSGTFEELLEAITWRRLGLVECPIVIVNTNEYYGPLIEMLESSVEQRFMDQNHLTLWSVVDDVEQVLNAITS